MAALVMCLWQKSGIGGLACRKDREESEWVLDSSNGTPRCVQKSQRGALCHGVMPFRTLRKIAQGMFWPAPLQCLKIMTPPHARPRSRGIRCPEPPQDGAVPPRVVASTHCHWRRASRRARARDGCNASYETSAHGRRIRHRCVRGRSTIGQRRGHARNLNGNTPRRLPPIRRLQIAPTYSPPYMTASLRTAASRMCSHRARRSRRPGSWRVLCVSRPGSAPSSYEALC